MKEKHLFFFCLVIFAGGKFLPFGLTRCVVYRTCIKRRDFHYFTVASQITITWIGCQCAVVNTATHVGRREKTPQRLVLCRKANERLILAGTLTGCPATCATAGRIFLRQHIRLVLLGQNLLRMVSYHTHSLHVTPTQGHIHSLTGSLFLLWCFVVSHNNPLIQSTPTVSNQWTVCHCFPNSHLSPAN